MYFLFLLKEMSIVLHITLLGNPAVTLLSGGHPDVGEHFSDLVLAYVGTNPP